MTRDDVGGNDEAVDVNDNGDLGLEDDRSADGQLVVRRRLPPMSVFPTLCTLGNLLSGFAAIHYAAKPLSFTGPWEWTGLYFAAVLIFVGMAFDAFDGALARLTRSTSDLGAQLDSLADVVTFGVAPAFLTIMLVSHYLGEHGTDYAIIGPEADNIFGRIVWGAAAAYLCCTALRLARFNVETPSATVEAHLYFRGLPSPGAAGAVASLILLHQELADNPDVAQAFVRAAAMVIPLVTILCAFAMVSSMPYSHVINRYLRGGRSFKFIVYLVIPLIVLIWWFQFLAALVLLAYVLSAPVQRLYRQIKHGKRSAKRT